MKVLLTILMALLPLQIQAQEVLDPTQQTPEDAAIQKEIEALPPLSEEECATFKKEIQQGIKDLNACWQNEDCLAVDLGYPWQEGICIPDYISTSDENAARSVKRKLVEYAQQCIWPNDKELEAYIAFNTQVDATKCAYPKLVCIQGFCRNPTQVLIQEQLQ